MNDKHLLDGTGDKIHIGEQLIFRSVTEAEWLGTLIDRPDNCVAIRWESGYQLLRAKKVVCVHQRFEFE